jgi:hypothetical protein
MKRTRWRRRSDQSLDDGSFGLITYRDSPSGRGHILRHRQVEGIPVGRARVVRPGNKLATEWLLKLLKHKSRKLVAVALANKMARIAWAVMTRGEAIAISHRSGCAVSHVSSRNDLRVFTARRRRGSSVGRTRGCSGSMRRY